MEVQKYQDQIEELNEKAFKVPSLIHIYRRYSMITAFRTGLAVSERELCDIARVQSVLRLGGSLAQILK